MQFCPRLKLFKRLTSFFCNLKNIQRSQPEDLLLGNLLGTNIEQDCRIGKKMLNLLHTTRHGWMASPRRDPILPSGAWVPRGRRADATAPLTKPVRPRRKCKGPTPIDEESRTSYPCPMSAKSLLYERDFFAWSRQQAELLRAGKLADADIDHIAEEIDSMGRTEKRELVSRLSVLLLHLLKWRFQPEKRGPSWEASIRVQRNRLADHLDDNPSLKPLLPKALASAYRDASLEVVAETGLQGSTFPGACPWTADEVLDSGFWPR